MVKQFIFFLVLIFISFSFCLRNKIKTPDQSGSNSNSTHQKGFTISLKKHKSFDKVAAISFISEIQNSMGKYKKCNFINLF
jgi:hypothetical protein